MAKSKEVSIQTVEKLLKEKKVPNIQLTAIKEIIEAAKHTNPKGRRYNDK